MQTNSEIEHKKDIIMGILIFTVHNKLITQRNTIDIGRLKSVILKPSK